MFFSYYSIANQRLILENKMATFNLIHEKIMAGRLLTKQHYEIDLHTKI